MKKIDTATRQNEVICTNAIRAHISTEYSNGKVYYSSGFSSDGTEARTFINGRIELQRVALPDPIAQDLQRLHRLYSYEGAT